MPAGVIAHQHRSSTPSPPRLVAPIHMRREPCAAGTVRVKPSPLATSAPFARPHALSLMGMIAQWMTSPSPILEGVELGAPGHFVVVVVVVAATV